MAETKRYKKKNPLTTSGFFYEYYYSFTYKENHFFTMAAS